MWKQVFDEEVNSSLRELPQQMQTNVLFSFFQKTSLGIGSELSWISLFPSPAYSFLDSYISLPAKNLHQLTKAHVLSLLIHYLDDQIIDERSDSIVNFSLIHFRTVVWKKMIGYVEDLKEVMGESGVRNFQFSVENYLTSVEKRNHHFVTEISFSEELFLKQVGITITLPYEVAKHCLGESEAEILWGLMKGFGFSWRLFDDFLDETGNGLFDKNKYLLSEKEKISSMLPLPTESSPLFSYYLDVKGFLKRV